MDVLHDTSWRQWLKIASTYKVPKYVLEHSPMEKTAADAMDDALFADFGKKMFPIDTAANTWLSAAYFNENRNSVDDIVRAQVESNIKMAASIWNIDKDVKDVLEFKTAEYLPESDLQNYGYVDKKGNRYFPMFDAEGVKRAADNFDRFRGSLPADVRKKIACAIVKKAHAGNISIQGSLFREAGIGLPNKIDLMDNMLDRAYLTKNAECATVIAGLVKVVAASQPDELMDNLDKLAHVLSELDKMNGMDLEYGRKLLAPADFVYGMMQKEAAAFIKDALTLDQHTFSIHKLAEVDPSVFKTALGDDLFKAISDKAGKLDTAKMAEVLPTLPRPDRIVLEGHIIACCE